jgi:hypothetical protein
VLTFGLWGAREALDAKGLKALPHGSKLPGPLAASSVARMLSNRYYIGKVIFKDMERHSKVGPSTTFQDLELEIVNGQA